MRFNSGYCGPQGFAGDDEGYRGSRFSEVREQLFNNAYYLTWGAADEPTLPVYGTSLWRMHCGVLPFGRPWRFLEAARRTIDSLADMRWGPDGRGFRRIIHPNGVCLFGTWEIDPQAAGTQYSGYFKPGSKCLIIARYSTGIGIRRGDWRTLSLVGKLYPTEDKDHQQPLCTANFITQEELGGAKTGFINDAVLRNAPDTTPWRRRLADVPKLLLTGVALTIADTKATIRQLYSIAELGKPEVEPTNSPEFMQLLVDPQQPRIQGDDIDLRDEILAQIYDKGNSAKKRTLTFNIEVSDEGSTKGKLFQRRIIKNWKRIGRIIFDEAVASYNGDFVLHFHHPPWRNDHNNPSSVARQPRLH
jgi:hypothetical protein